jgi:hypothetical protein
MIFLEPVFSNLVEEGFVADLQEARGRLAIPIRALKGLADGFYFRLILEATHQGF